MIMHVQTLLLWLLLSLKSSDWIMIFWRVVLVVFVVIVKRQLVDKCHVFLLLLLFLMTIMIPENNINLVMVVVFVNIHPATTLNIWKRKTKTDDYCHDDRQHESKRYNVVISVVRRCFMMIKSVMIMIVTAVVTTITQRSLTQLSFSFSSWRHDCISTSLIITITTPRHVKIKNKKCRSSFQWCVTTPPTFVDL